MGALGSSPELVQHAEAVSESADETSTPKAIGSLGSSTDLLQRVTDQAGPSAQSKNSSPKSDERWVAGHGGPTSLQRSTATAQDTGPAGETQVPDAVRDVISSPGRSLDTSIQRAVEDRMGDSLGDVRIHTGPKAAQACDQINARAFTVGNHVAFNAGEYDPSSPEGQHVLAHELAHVRQQTGGAVSMLPQENLGLEIDPDP
ncbi:eCIS core domain-containing protein, partial [Natrinema altunense]